jgi:hypothetical protein
MFDPTICDLNRFLEQNGRTEFATAQLGAARMNRRAQGTSKKLTRSFLFQGAQQLLVDIPFL